MFFYKLCHNSKTDFYLKSNSIVGRMVKWHKLLTFSWHPISSKFRLSYCHLILLERVLTKADKM